MNTPNSVLGRQTGAIRARLRPSGIPPRPIPCPPERLIGPIGGER
jgi:hypothetical protein